MLAQWTLKQNTSVHIRGGIMYLGRYQPNGVPCKIHVESSKRDLPEDRDL